MTGATRALQGSALVLSLLSIRCVSREREVKAIANGVVAGIAGTRGYFGAEAATICAELPTAETPVVPPLDKVCSRGCVCASTAEPDVDPRTTYDCDLWMEREWQLLRFTGMYRLDKKPHPKVFVHHQASWRRTDQGCRLDFTVYGDLDEDGVYSTYATSTETSPDGSWGGSPDVSVLWE